MVTAWTKVYLAWTMYYTAERTQGWSFLNIARNDIMEYHKDKLGQHPAELVVQSSFAHFSYVCNAIPTGECFALVIDKLEDQRSQGRIVDLEHLFDVRLRGSLLTERALEDTPTVVTEMIQQLAPGHPRALIGRSFLGWAYNQSSQFELAVETLFPVVAEMERVWGPDHSECLRTKLSLASSYINLNTIRDIVTGIEYVVLAFPACIETFGPEHAKSTSAAGILRRGMAMLPPEGRVVRHDIIAHGDHLLRTYNL